MRHLIWLHLFLLLFRLLLLGLLLLLLLLLVLSLLLLACLRILLLLLLNLRHVLRQVLDHVGHKLMGIIKQIVGSARSTFLLQLKRLALRIESSLWFLTLLAKNVLLDELVEVFEESGIGMTAFDDGVLLLARAEFVAEVADDVFRGDSQGAGDVGQVDDVGLDSVETRFFSQVHLRHLISPLGVFNG